MNTEEKHELQIRSAQKATIPAHGVVGHMRLKTAEAIPADCWLLVFSRPNLAKKGITVDSMVRRAEGEMTATVRNEGNREIRIEKGQRLASLTNREEQANPEDVLREPRKTCRKTCRRC